MKDFLIAALGVLLIVAFVAGLFGGIDWLVKRQTRDQTAALEHCVLSGYADAIHHLNSDTWLCIGVIDGEWRIEPIEVEAE